MQDQVKLTVKASPNDHLANERTFLAWIRTSIGIMGFGFVVVKFSLFAKAFTSAITTGMANSPDDSRLVGILLVVVGALMLLFAYFRYEKTKQHMEQGVYTHSSSFIKLITGVLILVSIVLIIYLIQTK